MGKLITTEPTKTFAKEDVLNENGFTSTRHDFQNAGVRGYLCEYEERTAGPDFVSVTLHVKEDAGPVEVTAGRDRVAVGFGHENAVFVTFEQARELAAQLQLVLAEVARRQLAV